MKLIAAISLILILVGCSSTSPPNASGPNVAKLSEPLVEKEAPGLHLDGMLKIMGNWAFFIGDTVNDSGEAVTPPDGISSDTVILFRKLEGEWLVVEHGIGISDAYYFGWYETHDLPEGLLEP